MKNFFSIGEVSKMFDVSIDTLRYYDRLGILSPKVNKENNYRMYSLKEIYLLSLVLGARYLEVPISDIKDFLNRETLDFDVYLDFLENQNKILNNKIKYLKKIQKSVDTSKKIVKRAKSYENILDFSKIEIRKDKKEFYVVPIKKLISSNLCKRFSKAIEIDNKSLEYSTEFKIDYEKERIYPVDEIIYIEKSNDADRVINKLRKNRNIEIKEESMSNMYIELEFLGTEEELKTYIKEIIKYFNITRESILIKFLSIFKTKNEEISFIHIFCSM